MTDRVQLIYKARLAEQAERYTDMVETMKTIAEMDEEMTDDERNLLSVAFKNVVGAHRTSWRLICDVEHKTQGDPSRIEMIKEYKKKIEGELDKSCLETLSLIDKYLIPKSKDVESSVFNHKMKADYLRYMAETKFGKEREELASKAYEVYNNAYEQAKQLSPTHPIRLGLVLNFSVFYYEINFSSEKACELAKAAFDEAIPELDSMSDDKGRDATIILQLLRDNLTLWNSNIQQTDDQENDIY